MTRLRDTGFTLIVVLTSIATGILASVLVGGSETVGIVRAILISVSLVGINSVAYFAWFSRWNVFAHISLIFSMVAYVLPILILGKLSSLDDSAVALYTRIVSIGFGAAAIGAILGLLLVNSRAVSTWLGSLHLGERAVSQIERRSVFASVVGVTLLAGSFIHMRMLPATADDPFSAKFFRGVYRAAYEDVAIPYRLSTTMLALLLPLLALAAWRRRSLPTMALLGFAVTLLLLGLLRGPAMSGLLLFAAILLTVKGRPCWVFAMLTGSYVAGGLWYRILGFFGIGSFSTTAAAVGWLESLSATVPDVQDHLVFLRAWLQHPISPGGRTFWGGLIPGNYEWNPSVWALAVANPGQAVEDIASGGFRLPPPIWGYVNFGWAGLIGVCIVYGLIVGILARLAARVITNQPLSVALPWTVLYGAVTAVLTQFYSLSYLSVIGLIIVTWIFRPAAVSQDLPATTQHAKLHDPARDPNLPLDELQNHADARQLVRSASL